MAKGGDSITFNYTTQAPLGAPEFRAFYLGENTVAEYYLNLLATEVGTNQYTVTIDSHERERRALAIGDLIEIEISQFLEGATNGRDNYYGTTFLYVVGTGVVPWYGVGDMLDSVPVPESAWLGGLTTLPFQYSDEPDHRYKQTAGNIAPASIQPFLQGRRLHHTDFLDGSHSESGNPVFSEQVNHLDGQYIARSCVSCHVNNGRGLLPAVGQSVDHAVVQVAADAFGTPHEVLGSVLQPLSTDDDGEGAIRLSGFVIQEGVYGDGTSYELRQPQYGFEGEAPSFYSVRMSQQLIGLGLLEAIPEESLESLADPDDDDGDGISGRVQVVVDPETGEDRVGRFTHKAGQASVRHQIAAALNTDMGVTSPVYLTTDAGHTDAVPDLDEDELQEMTRYISLLGVGARRDFENETALQGETLFSTAGCADCHTPTMVTGSFHPMAELRNQTIHPYTDLLLHDMGDGLADNVGEGRASGAEWRTPPLWNIGLTAGVSGGEGYLHDGRARTLEEAILWHGGEATAAKEAFRLMSASDRAALVSFLKSL